MHLKSLCIPIFIPAEWTYYATNFMGVVKQRSMKYYSWKEQTHENQFSVSSFSLSVSLTANTIFFFFFGMYIYMCICIYIYVCKYEKAVLLFESNEISSKAAPDPSQMVLLMAQGSGKILFHRNVIHHSQCTVNMPCIIPGWSYHMK